VRRNRCYTLADWGAYAQQLRKRTNDTQADAARKVGAVQSAVSGAERGLSRDFATLAKLLRHYGGVTLSEPYYKGEW